MIDRGTALILTIWSLSENLLEAMPVGVMVFSNISKVTGLVFQHHMWSVPPVNCSMPDMLLVINTSCFLKYCYQQVRVVLFGTSLSGETLLNASSSRAEGFDAEQCSRMKSSFARKYIVLTPAELVRSSWTMATRVTLTRVLLQNFQESITWGKQFVTSFLYHNMWLLNGFCFKWHNLYWALC